MRIFEIEKPKSPEQLRLDQLRANSKRASNAVKAERNRQKLQLQAQIWPTPARWTGLQFYNLGPSSETKCHHGTAEKITSYRANSCIFDEDLRQMIAS